MPVPKRKTSKSRRDRRSSCKFIRPSLPATCKNCNEVLPGHSCCDACGFYKGKKIFAGRLDKLIKRKQKAEAARTAQSTAQQQQEAQGE